MLSEREGKSMETRNAEIILRDEKYYLALAISSGASEICLTEDNPNSVKETFNKLIKELKNGQFIYEFKQTESSLYSQISEEYIRQLNSELKSIYKQLETFKLLNREDVKNSA